MNELLTTIDAIQGAGFVGLLIVLAVPKLRKIVFGNGNGHDHKESEAKIIEKLETNHLHEWGTKLDELIKVTRENNYILKDIKNDKK